MIALCRYVIGALLRTQRWVAPLVALGIAFLIVWSAPPMSLDSVGLTLMVIFPVAAWLSYATATVESTGQAMIMASHAGSDARVWLAKSLTALLLTLVVPFVTILVATVAAGWQPRETGLAALAVTATALAGVALGTLVGEALPARPGWALLILLTASLLDLSVPYAPPVRGFATLLLAEQPSVSLLVGQVAGSLLISAAAFAATAVHRRLSR